LTHFDGVLIVDWTLLFVVLFGIEPNKKIQTAKKPGGYAWVGKFS
jgi:hypothetical protein